MKEETMSHVNSKGEAHMVDVGDKPVQKRTAEATGKIILTSGTIKKVTENSLKKGDVLSVARIAGIQGAKQTSMLIPLCHTLLLSKIEVNFILEEDGIRVNSQVKCDGKTGVEMEALTAVNIALLTIYDMCKAVDKKMSFQDVRLIKKTKQ